MEFNSAAIGLICMLNESNHSGLPFYIWADSDLGVRVAAVATAASLWDIQRIKHPVAYSPEIGIARSTFIGDIQPSPPEWAILPRPDKLTVFEPIIRNGFFAMPFFLPQYHPFSCIALSHLRVALFRIEHARTEKDLHAYIGYSRNVCLDCDTYVGARAIAVMRNGSYYGAFGQDDFFRKLNTCEIPPVEFEEEKIGEKEMDGIREFMQAVHKHFVESMEAMPDVEGMTLPPMVMP